MKYSIENEWMSIEVNDFGAELCSLYDKIKEKEYLWHGETIWKRQSPILFPNVGGLYENQYVYQNKNYHMPAHGFARDSEFILFSKKNHELIFLLESNPSTKRIYPFDFDLYISYILEGKNLKVMWQVINKGNESMFFNIGAHPAFMLSKGTTISDYTLYFDKKIEVKTPKVENRLVSEKFFQLPQYNGSVKKLKMNTALFDYDTLILNGGLEKITVKNRQGDFNLSVSFKGFPYVALWTINDMLPDVPFLCIEPWHGINDNIDQGVKEIAEKKGIIALASQQRWQSSYLITIEHD